MTQRAKIRKKIEKQAHKEFLEHLDKAIDCMYLARMENNGAVLTLPIVDLYRELTNNDK